MYVLFPDPIIFYN
jgi:hypothetical protein